MRRNADARRSGRESASGNDRGVTPLIGLVLLFAMVAAGSVLLVLTGTAIIDGLEERADEERSVQKMDAVRSGVEDVQYDQRERFEDVWATEELGTMTLEVNGRVEATRPMGAFLHESESGRYASQLGGTWTETDSGSRMIHEPQLEYERDSHAGTEVWRLTVPPIEVEEVTETTAGDDVVAGYRPTDDSVEAALIEGLDDDEPLRNVTIAVEDSPYADAWARYLEDELPTHREDSEVTRRGSTVVATAPLGADRSAPSEPARYDVERSAPSGGLVTTAEDLRLTNARVDSYDSAARPYAAHAPPERRDGAIEAAGDVELRGGAGNDQLVVHGDVRAGGSITASGPGPVASDDRIEDWDDYERPEPVTDRIDRIVSTVRDDREVDDGETSAIDDTAFDGGTVDSGVYYLEDAHIDDELELDASDGDVVVVVDGDLTIDADVTVTTGDSRTNQVRWFVTGDVTLEDDRAVDVEGDRAPQHWLFADDGSTTRIESSASFTGVVYAPGGEIDVGTGNQGGGGIDGGRTRVYGSLVGTVDAAGNVHFAYDRALEDGPRTVVDRGVVGPDRAFDARVTLAGADFGWNPQHGPYADLLDPADVVDPGERDSFEVEMPSEAFERVEDPDGRLEYFQTATGTTSSEERRASTIAGETSVGPSWRDGSVDGSDTDVDAADSTEIDVEAGETIVVTADDERTELSLSDAGLDSLFADDVASGQGRLEATVDETTTLDLGVATDEEREYELTVETHQYYEELTFEATEYDEFRVEVSSDDADFYAELRENGAVEDGPGLLFDEDARLTGDAGESADGTYRVYRTDTSFDGGEATIRIGNREGDEPIDYEVTLEQTAVDSSAFEIAGDPAWFQQFPIETALQFRDRNGTSVVRPWPETDVANASDPPAAHADDINHPAVDSPLTYEIEGLEPGTTFAPRLAWRDGFCESMDGYAGTWRRPDSGVYEDEVLFEMGCAKDEDGGFGLVDLSELLDPFGWFADDESADLNRELDALRYVEGGPGSEPDGERVKVLEDGDRIPDVEPFEAQRNLTQLLGEDVVVYDEAEGHYEVDLDSGEFVLLFELAPERYVDGEPTWDRALETESDAPDYNDVAMVFEITDVHGEDDGRNGGDGRNGDDGDSGRTHRDALDVADGVITAEAD